jgi:pyruvate-ferredoxin/flavodoxin oxidoreductase
MPREVQEEIIEKKLRFFVIDAYDVAKKAGLGTRINTIMQTCFFKISGIIPMEAALQEIKGAIKKSYGKKGEEIVKRNFEAVDQSIAELREVPVPKSASSSLQRPPVVAPEAPEFVRKVTAPMIAYQGDSLPVSSIPADGTFPTGTSRWEKRNVALEIPAWDPEVCIQCGKCVMICPHATIRMKAYDEAHLAGAPSTFKSTKVRGKEFGDARFTIQIAPEDCTGCGLCVHVCPAKNKRETRLKAINMASQPPIRESERDNYEFFLKLPDIERSKVKMDSVRGSQFLEPLFEASGACAGCGETPYVKLMSQLFGDRLLIGNATGCSSIYCGNLPTTPWSKNREGRGPAWSNSLFEDCAEFSMGFRLAVDKKKEQACELVAKLESVIGADLARALIESEQADEPEIFEQRGRVEQLREKLEGVDSPEARHLLDLADYLVKKSIWALGGDGWAYDIGYGGLDHVLASNRDVNLLVMDTEVYSNTGGQMSKATPRAAVAKFAAAGKPTPKKDLALLAMSYGNVYVARVAMGASDTQTVRAFIEAERYKGPSLILAYSHCIAHGINMRTGVDNQKAAVQSGHWPLCRYDPNKVREGKNPLSLDSPAPKIPFTDYAWKEARYKVLQKINPQAAKDLAVLAQQDVNARWRLYEQLANLQYERTDQVKAEA